MIEVTAGVIEQEGKILITKRAAGDKRGGLWEFPGGKVEKGEKPEECLIREINEELEILIEVKNHIIDSEYKYEDIHINLRAYRAIYLGGDIKLNVHEDYKWVEAENLCDYSFAPADIPIVEVIKKNN